MRAPALLVAAAMAIAGCSGGSSPDAIDAEPSGTVADADGEPTDVDDAAFDSIEWAPCEDGLEVPGTPLLDCGTIDVPLDHADPDGPTIPIALARQEAAEPSERIGSIVFNPGGPGGSGIEYLDAARFAIPPDVADAFDLVSFDPRGVGASASVHCDLTRDDGVVLIDDDDRAAWERALETAYDELATCTSEPAGIEPYVGTNQAARDLDHIRAALGDEQLTYVGFSYGTRLGATYAALFPDRVRALVLDGGVLPTTDSTRMAIEQAGGFDLALGNFAAACDADPDCVVSQYGPTLEVLDELRTDIAAAGSYPTDDPARVLTPGELDLGVIASLYNQANWSLLALAIDEAMSEGTGGLFQALADLYLGREPDGEYTNQVEAGAFINCADDPARPSEDEVWEEADMVADASDHFSADLRASFGCLGFPEPIDPLQLGDADGAPPILVIGTTGDPATPYEWSVELADSLASGVLFSVDGEGHTAYTSIACVQPVVDAYLIDLEVPEPGDGCADDSGVDPFPPTGESDVEMVIGFVDCMRDAGVELDAITAADVLRDPAGEALLGALDLDDPGVIAGVVECQDYLLG